MKSRPFFLLILASILLPHVLASFLNALKGAKTEYESWAERKPKEITGSFPKYFHEAGKGEIPNHYDGRYQHGILDYNDKQDAQVHMVRAYLGFFREHNLETWLAHGTLLGWWWNGKCLPWDWDMDMQVAHPTLMYLATHHNFTNYTYTSSSPIVTLDSESNSETDSDSSTPIITRNYLLDINPAYSERGHGNGNNVIDARWIDLRNGLYIDITGVSEVRPHESPGVWSCKNLHRYNTSDLYPMRETVFESVRAKVPFAYAAILVAEYQEKALVWTKFRGHRWDETRRLWVKMSEGEMRGEKMLGESALGPGGSGSGSGRKGRKKGKEGKKSKSKGKEKAKDAGQHVAAQAQSMSLLKGGGKGKSERAEE